jgi:hypothetical protein
VALADLVLVATIGNKEIGDLMGRGMQSRVIVSRGFMPLIGALALAACASDVGPSDAELKARWEAQNVYPAAYKSDLLAFLRSYLNDPSHVRDAAVSVPQLKPAGPGPRYVACVSGDGKYQGPKENAAVYTSGKFERFLDRPRDVRELCADATYAPFPELEELTR